MYVCITIFENVYMPTIYVVLTMSSLRFGIANKRSVVILVQHACCTHTNIILNEKNKTQKLAPSL